MDSMDNFRERFEALEQQTEQLKQHTQALEAHTHTVERRLRWWRGIACGIVMLSLLSLALPSGKAADAPGRGMAERMATLEDKLAAMAFDAATNEVVITGANLRIVNGLGDTRTINGLGNLIVGYNEPRGPEDQNQFGPDNRIGSHNVVVGKGQNFSSFGGLVVSELNEISGAFASVSGGFGNKASGSHSSVSGGRENTASGSFCSTVSGGAGNTASEFNSSVSGGANNTASGVASAVCGGVLNTASARSSSVSGGIGNTASGEVSSVSGGRENMASGFESSSVSGGYRNTASGFAASVSGGADRSAPGQFDWAAGPLFADE